MPRFITRLVTSPLPSDDIDLADVALLISTVSSLLIHIS